MTTICSIIKTENGTHRQLNTGRDLAGAIYSRFHEISASYSQWEIIKEWTLKN